LVVSAAAKAQFAQLAAQTRSQLQTAASMAGQTSFSE